jgi:hypothetical protein
VTEMTEIITEMIPEIQDLQIYMTIEHRKRIFLNKHNYNDRYIQVLVSLKIFKIEAESQTADIPKFLWTATFKVSRQLPEI